MTVNVSPLDFTGREKARLAKIHEAEQRKAAAEMALMTAQAEEVKAGVTDYTDLYPPRTEVTWIEDEETKQIKPVEVEVNEPVKKMRVNTDLEQVTIGHGREFTFEQGQYYKVPAYVYDHLDEKGFVWH
jgi:hypothetical protein